MEDTRAEDVARFFDEAACCGSSRGRPADRRLRPVSRVLLGLLEDVGLSGRTVLDAGCGQGRLTVALAERGAAGVTGIDLSSQSIAAAQEAAEQAGVPARLLVANAATDALEPHDVVVLDKVVCCYFDADALLANVSPAARSVLALSLPHARGLRGTLARLAVSAENGWRRLRGDPFRAYVHDEAAIVRRLEEDGWSRTAERGHWLWHLTVLERPA